MMRRIVMSILFCFLLTLKAEAYPVEHSTAIIFVSFSMPKQSLIAYLTDAKKIHASVVIRGLVNNSFKKTFTQISELIKQSGGGVELNPPLFQKFNIHQVPAVVVLSDTQNGYENDFDMISGDIPLRAALKEIRDKGIVSTRNANELLLQLHESSYV
jgi:conjugal transfer pilus assembly protein TrbC